MASLKDVSLSNVSGRSLVPNLSSSLNVLLSTFGTKQERDEEKREADEAEAAKQAEIALQAEIDRQVDILSGDSLDPKAEKAALLRLGALDPALANATRQTLESGDQQQIDALRQTAEQGARDSVLVSSQPDFASKQRAISELAAAAAARGEPMDRFIQLQNMSEPQLDLELQRMQIAAQDLNTLLKPVEVAKPSTATGKARQDLNNGLITQGEFDAITKAPVEFQTDVGRLISDRQLAVGALGPDSLGVAAIDAQLESLLNGKPVVPQFETFTDVNGNIFDVDIKTAEGAEIAAETVAAGGRQGGPKETKITAKERESAGFATRLQASSVILDELQDEFAGFSAGMGSILPNFAKSEERQRFEQATRNFINAVLRNESGAAIAASEFESAEKQYIPQPGDSAAVLQQKKENRDLVTASFISASGRAIEPQETIAPEGPQEGVTATNPTTGEKLVFRGGQWQIQ